MHTLISFDKTNWLSIAAALITVTIVGVGLSLSMPLLAMLFELRKIPSSLIGLNAAISSIGAIAISPIVTPMAKKIGTAQLLIFSIILSAISLLSFFWITNFWAIIPLRFIFHAAITTIIILSEFWINAASPQFKRGVILGAYATMLSLGFMIGPLILKSSDIHSMTPFLCGATIIFMSVIPVFASLHQIPEILAEETKTSFWKFFALAPLAMGAVLVFGISESGLLSIFPVYGLKIGYQAQEFAIFLIAMGLGNIVFQIPIGFLIDRSKKIWLFSLFTLFGTAGAICIPFIAQHKLVLGIIIFFWGGIIPGLYTVGLVSIGSRFNGAELAAANAAFIMTYSTGMFMGPLIVGTSMDIWEPHGAMGIIAFIFGIYGVYILSRVSNRKENIMRVSYD